MELSQGDLSICCPLTTSRHDLTVHDQARVTAHLSRCTPPSCRHDHEPIHILRVRSVFGSTDGTIRHGSRSNCERGRLFARIGGQQHSPRLAARWLAQSVTMVKSENPELSVVRTSWKYCGKSRTGNMGIKRRIDGPGNELSRSCQLCLAKWSGQLPSSAPTRPSSCRVCYPACKITHLSPGLSDNTLGLSRAEIKDTLPVCISLRYPEGSANKSSKNHYRHSTLDTVFLTKGTPPCDGRPNYAQRTH
ncbi:hypothetical protein J6590_014569 [Homalodisca vitripennis]|nr:hypothetical protein J6590_014569 [Homalodisca vitripennis]